MTSPALTNVFTPFPVLETPRLRLRELHPRDAAALAAFWGDPEVVRFLDGPALTTPDEAMEIVTWAQGVRRKLIGIRWGITLKGDDKIIGTCGFHRWEQDQFHADVGYELARSCWRQGIMREAITAILSFGFGAMQLHRVQATIVPGNEASAALVLKMGFQYEGLLRDYEYYLDAFHSLDLYSLLASEWQG